MSKKREIYVHEDDYCQQQLLPRKAAEFAGTELKKIGDFANAHRAPDGLGWTEMYVRKKAPVELPALKIKREDFASIVSLSFPLFDAVFTGYSSYREPCNKTAAWGTTDQCALFANWDDDGIIQSIWAEFFDRDKESINAATSVVRALGVRYPLVYVDWAWGYVCEAHDSASFSSMLQSKLEAIINNLKTFKTT